MNQKINTLITKIQQSWSAMDNTSLLEIQVLMSGLDKQAVIELAEYRDPDLGFILFYYTESKGDYRIPHNHGDAWVIYAVVEGEVEMGNYFNWVKQTEVLSKGDTRIYFPGDIHDTRCLSDNAKIVRLTSCDLKVEESQGRMLRFIN